jgi:hypothetical protein
LVCCAWYVVRFVCRVKNGGKKYSRGNSNGVVVELVIVTCSKMSGWKIYEEDASDRFLFGDDA